MSKNEKKNGSVHGHASIEVNAEEARPTASTVTSSLGVKLSAPLDAAVIKRLRSSLPGYAGVLSNVGQKLERDAGELELRADVSAQITKLLADREVLTNAEAVLETAHRSAYEQRLVLDDQAMALLRKVNHRVLESEDAELRARWDFLSRYVEAFAPGPKKSQGTEPSGDPAEAPSAATSVKSG